MNVFHPFRTLTWMAVAIFAFTSSAGFIEVPQKSASDYIFITPVLTNNIQGKVIDPSAPYGVIRSEDVDWFSEAFVERECLLAGSIPRPSLGVGANIRQPEFGLFWNGYVRGSPYGWLDPDVQLFGGSRLVNRFYSLQSVTNVFSNAFLTNGVTNAFSVITMPLTNGTTSVFTNKWDARKLFQSGLTREITNVVSKSLIDLCCDGTEIFTGYTNTPRIAFGSVVTSNGNIRLAFTETPNAGVFSNACEVLKGTKRLADANVNVTNTVMSVFEYVFHEIENSYEKRDDGERAGIYKVISYDDYVERTYTPAFTAIIPTRFGDHIATTGGVSRVSAKAVYVLCDFSYKHEEHGQVVANVSTGVVMRLSGTLDASGETAVVKFRHDAFALCSSAAQAAGCPAPPASVESYREEGLGYASEWNISFAQYAIIYSITPSTVFPNW